MDYTFLFIAGIVIITMSLMLNHFKRQRLDAERLAKRRAAVEAARAAERKLQLQSNEPVKTKPEKSYSSLSDRMPQTETLGKPFTGGIMPRDVAKWEIEIDKIGRQWAGTLDSKMVALQTLTQEANRVANRMELLLEQFERFAQAGAEPKTIKIEESPQSFIDDDITTEESATETLTVSSLKQSEEPSNFIPAGETDYPATPLILDDLETEIDRLQQQIADEALKQTSSEAMRATILKIDDSVPITPSKPTEPNEEQPAPRISISAFGSPSTASTSASSSRDHYTKPSYPLDSLSNGSRRITVSPSLTLAPMGNLSFDSLYDDQPSKRGIEITASKPSVNESSAVSLNLQKQVEMLHNYGYTPRQIAQSLNITVGEVDLMLK